MRKNYHPLVFALGPGIGILLLFGVIGFAYHCMEMRVEEPNFGSRICVDRPTHYVHSITINGSSKVRVTNVDGEEYIVISRHESPEVEIKQVKD